MLNNTSILLWILLLCWLEASFAETSLFDPIGVTSVATTDASSCAASDGSIEITLDASNLGVSPYDISVDNGTTWIEIDQVPAPGGILSVTGQKWGQYPLAIRDAAGDIIFPGYANIEGCTPSYPQAANPSFSAALVSGATSYNWTTSQGSIILGQTTTTATFDFSSVPNNTLVDVCVQPTGATCTAPATCFEVRILNVPEDCTNGFDDDGDGLIDCADCVDCAAEIACGDNDGDGIGNYCDLDDDNDGIPDLDECPALTYGPELISNGDFENGYANWTSYFNRGSNNNLGSNDGCGDQGWIALTQCATENGLCPDYFNYSGSTPTGSTVITDAIGTGANIVNTTACNVSTYGCEPSILPDHTSGSGLSLYIDPSDVPSRAYWQQTITISANTNYEFSAWLMVIEEDPNLVFTIDGSNIGPSFNLDRKTGGSDGPDVWQQFFVEWNSGATSGSVTIELLNLTAGCNGNDIRVDDISLRSRSVSCDADKDGISNYLDLDSDNDGIYDLVEAGHDAVDENNDGIIDGASADFGTNGLFDDIETAADSDVLNYVISDSESTSDGIYDAYELDSDGDGCFDTVEESIADSEEDGTAGTGIPSVSSAGLITTLTYAVITKNQWQKPTVGVCLPENCANGIDDDGDGLIDCADCADCASTVACNDIDNDNVGDFCDLDNDNDGIPDLDEGCGTTTDVSGTVTMGDNVVNASNYTIVGTSITYNRSGANQASIYGYSAGSQGDAIRFRSGGTASGSLISTFSVPITSVSFKLTDFDEYEDYTVDVYDEFNVLYDLTTEGLVSVGSLIIQTGNQFICSTSETSAGGPAVDGNDPDDDNLGSVVFHFPGKVSRIEITYVHVRGCSIRYIEPTYCSTDTDGDGLLNYLDLDSDNDGIYDLVEAGHTAIDANTDGIIDGVSADFGTNGLFDGIETVADSDVISYSISDSEAAPDGIYDAYELDSDGDGCFDTEEENVPDTDSDGIAGTGVPAVSATGLVSGSAYAIPTKNQWQNPLVGVCLPEDCANGIDDDGDGLVDCYDCVDCASAGACDDADGDGLGDYCDLDDDNDGILDKVECNLPVGTIASASAYQWYSTISGSLIHTFVETVNNSGDGYKQSGFEKFVYDRVLDITNLNSTNDFTFSGSGNSTVTTFENGTVTYDSDLTVGIDLSVSNTTSTGFVSGTTGDGIMMILSNPGITTGDYMEASINFTDPVQSFSFDIADMLDNSPATLFVRIDVSVNGDVVAYIIGNYVGSDISGQADLYDHAGGYLGKIDVGQNKENSFGFFSSTGITTVDLLYTVLSGTAGQREAIGLDNFTYSTECSRDTDNDGTPNHLDTDSDNDGCPDALEGDAPYSQIGYSDLTVDDRITGSIDTDGVPVTASGGQGQGTSYDANLQASECSSCSADNPNYVDVDGDSIGDPCDLDDDNDGIPDLIEMDCPSGYIALAKIFSDNTSNPGTQAGIYPHGGVSVDLSYELAGSANWATGVSSSTSGSISGAFINTQSRNTNSLNGDVSTYTLTFSEPVHNLSFKMGGFDHQDRADLTANNSGTNVPVVITDINLNNGYITGQTVADISGSTATSPSNSVQIYLPEAVSQVTIVTGKDDGDAATVTLQIFDVTYCTTRDTDTDGIADHLDLDSDNDGIYDLIESGHTATDANIDGIIDGAPADFGTNGLYDGIETAADSDVIDYTVSDSEAAPDGIYDAYEIDSDGDGCFDTEEETVSDTDEDGIAGTGVPVVFANGLIDGLTYVVPTVNQWQNPSLGICLPEDCTNLIDDDGDGLIDCEDEECPGANPAIRVEQL